MGADVPGIIVHKASLAFCNAFCACREHKLPDTNPLSHWGVYTCPNPCRTTSIEDLKPVAVVFVGRLRDAGRGSIGDAPAYADQCECRHKEERDRLQQEWRQKRKD